MIARAAAIATAVLRVAAVVAVASAVFAMAAEILLRYNTAITAGYAPRTRLGDLTRAYLPFTVQHLHPQYLFFFPLDPAERIALGNEVCSIDDQGFREPGPAHRDGRKLAVMLGGSALFGHFASANTTTITSRLNQLQDEYFFVNAGVPSWNSTQQLQRLIVQIADLRPSLVIAFDGANDAGLAGRGSSRRDLMFPPGTPDSFDDLELWVDDIRADRFSFRMPPLFPEIADRLNRYRDAVRVAEEETPVVEADVADAARHYLANQQRMATISRTIGARFVSVFQPVASLHRNVPATWRNTLAAEAPFHGLVVRHTTGYEFHDLATMFDAHFAAIPVAMPEINDQTIFVDDLHVFDPGTELIAQRLLEIVRTPPAS
jgi:hypothetical protein